MTTTEYDGTGTFPAADAPAQTPLQRTVQLTVTGLIVTVPVGGLAVAVWLLWAEASA
jgi:hypothetical protein